MASANWMRLGLKLGVIEKTLETLDKNCGEYVKRKKDDPYRSWWRYDRFYELEYLLKAIRWTLEFLAGKRIESEYEHDENKDFLWSLRQSLEVDISFEGSSMIPIWGIEDFLNKMQTFLSSLLTEALHETSEYYAPGGEGATQAQEHFERLQDQVKSL